MLSWRNLSALMLLLLLVSCKQQKVEMKLYFAGDLLLDRGVRWQIEHRKPETIFSKIKPMFANADAVIVNLESPVTKLVAPINKQFIFRGEPEWLAAVKDAGITHLMMTNNHTNDQGRAGMTDTYQNISKFGMSAVGYGNNQTSACEPVVISKEGISVAIFGSVLLPLENWAYLVDSPGICQASAEELALNIQRYKEANPDTRVIVVLHWGIEYEKSANANQHRQAHLLIDAGADAIIGHHPHVVQNLAYYRGKPIIFSLGNFVFDQRPPGDEAMIAELIITTDSMQTITHPIKITNCSPSLMGK